MKVIVTGKGIGLLKKPVVICAAALVIICGIVYFGLRGGTEKASGAGEVIPIETVKTEKNEISAALSTLEHFGAASAEEAVNIWAEGVSAKNGITQYSVMNSELKTQYLSVAENKYGSLLFPTNEKSIAGWFIADVEALANGQSRIQLQFSISEPGKEGASSSAELIIAEEGGFTVICSVAVEKGLYEFTGIG